jgi:hypothetical protein
MPVFISIKIKIKSHDQKSNRNGSNGPRSPAHGLGARLNRIGIPGAGRENDAGIGRFGE